jgi:hypothetical protein
MGDFGERERAETIVKEFLDDAVRHVDTKFGKGFAEKNPSLVGSVMETTATIFSALKVSQSIRDKK